MKPKNNHLRSHKDRELQTLMLQTWRFGLLFLRYNRLGDKGMIQLSRSIKKAWDPGPRMQDAVGPRSYRTTQPTAIILLRKGKCLEVDGHLASTYLLFWHPNPGRVFPLGLPLRALDIFSGGNQNQIATSRSLIQQFLNDKSKSILSDI